MKTLTGEARQGVILLGALAFGFSSSSVVARATRTTPLE
jgi:hypothetical protein